MKLGSGGNFYYFCREYPGFESEFNHTFMLRLIPNKVPYPIPMPNNMGIVRYVLAFAVIVAHFNTLVGGDVWFPVTSYSAVGGFFALSGFLIYGSFLKHERTWRYVRQRALRILPAYWATVLIFAAGLVAVSSLSAWEYFTSPGFWKYLVANICFLNFIEPTLPGVFPDFAQRAVNVSLWTMKVEWMLYLSVPVVVWLIRKMRCRPVVMFIGIYVVSIAYRLLFNWLYYRTGSEIYQILGRQFVGQLMYFYTGVIIYYYYDVFMRYKWTVLVCGLVLMAVGSWIPYFSVVLHPLAFSSLVIWFSMVGRWGTFEGRRDNVSYNMYLVHGPILQLAAYFDLSSLLGMWGCFLISLLVIILLSLAINVCVEKPIQHRFRR